MAETRDQCIERLNNEQAKLEALHNVQGAAIGGGFAVAIGDWLGDQLEDEFTSG